ncbi:MAG: DUF58 domain-containing protein [Verrucomicrobiales bacterium]|nr:DUF58 domain-containing protein [Verrucomicrobiales bacterium]
MKERPKVVVSPSGATLFWLSVLAIPAGVFTYSGPAVILGLMGLVLIGIARFLAVRQLTDLRLSRRLPKRGFPGETFEIETRFENRRTYPASREIELIDTLAGHGGKGIHIAETGPGHSTRLSYPGKVFRRGRLRVPGYTLTSRWPFGFFEASLGGTFEPAAPGDESILIAPNPLLPPFVDRILLQFEQEAALFSELHPDDLTEFRALREFRSGDSLQSIHWPASSRSDAIIVREFDPPRPKPQCHGIFLHQFVPPGELNQPDRFERMLRIASGLLVRFQQRELPVVVRMNFAGKQIFRIPGEHHWHQALDALAEAESRPASTLDHIGEDWDIFEECDQVFVLGDWDRTAWQDKTEGLHSAVVCLDPFTGTVKKRSARVIKPAGKILTR